MEWGVVSREATKGELMNTFQPSHILLIVLVALILFGAKRLPDSARALGQSLRIFKSELKNNAEDKDSDSTQGPDKPNPSNK